MREEQLNNTIRYGGNTALWIAFTVYKVYTTWFLHCFAVNVKQLCNKKVLKYTNTYYDFLALWASGSGLGDWVISYKFIFKIKSQGIFHFFYFLVHQEESCLDVGKLLLKMCICCLRNVPFWATFLTNPFYKPVLEIQMALSPSAFALFRIFALIM